MHEPAPRAQQHPLVRIAFVFCALSCLSGAFFMTVKSPQAQSAALSAQAVYAAKQGQADHAIETAFQAVLLNPGAVKGWTVLSSVLDARGFNSLSEEAQTIALSLQQKPDDAARVYAVPAEFRLSLMSETGAGIQ
ncbi:MAG: hypothetical protein DI626_05260 [Micavibrio aeruginosavorus]|uniref:Tetratricopeptide repeat-like domain-containing protein n=1 Tax=Micavibrio aeruginosavorus TaxID=349221 RepID=A0A2W5BYU1_9BACT|nr:MAG: hypothetical protein DI626_05260 [Micavibrio aeruginosavorus]